MSILDGFLFRILKSFTGSGKEAGKMSIIVLRPYSFLVTELHGIFKGQEDVEVRVDRRFEQRRTKKESFSHEQRQSDRRSTKETLVEVVIST